MLTLLGTGQGNNGVTPFIRLSPSITYGDYLVGGSGIIVTDGIYNQIPASISYQWKRAGSNILGATTNTYIPLLTDENQNITCLVSATYGLETLTYETSPFLLKEEISKDKEGYVIRFKNGFRMKIKGEEYKRLHRILTNISNRDIWEYLKDGKPLDEILDKVPDEFYNWVKETKNTLETDYSKIENEYIWIYKILSRDEKINGRKIFAEYALKYKHPSILFSMYDNRDYKNIIWKILYPNYSKPFKKDDE